MKWYWVELYQLRDGYNDSLSWLLVAARDADHIREEWHRWGDEVRQVIPYEDKPVPKSPRKTKHIRVFNPELVQP